MSKDEERTIAIELIPNDTEEIVSDLLYTLFQTMEEYIMRNIQHGSGSEDLTLMKNYIEKDMRKYVKILYQVEIEETL